MTLEATILIPGQPPLKVTLDKEALTLGRGSGCDIVIPDASLSRQHARMTRNGDQWRIEDLGSHNGTRVNGRLISAPEPVKAGDELELGHARLTLAAARPAVSAVGASVIAATAGDLDGLSLRTPATALRTSLGLSAAPASADALPILETLQAMSELTLELLSELPPGALYEKLLDKLFALLKPERGALLLRGKSGEMEPALTRLPSGATGAIPISRTVIDAVVQRGEALLIDGRRINDSLAQAKSFAAGSLRMALAAPLENGGEVEGLIYLDAPIGRRIYGENDLRLVAALANIAAAKLQAARQAERIQANRALERDFALARDIQRKLLPASAPELPGYVLHGANSPSRQVSGDLYDFRIRPDGKIYLVIADVCGKGIGPALLMACMQTYLAAWTELMLPPAQLAAKLSAGIAGQAGSSRFITALIVLLDPASGAVEYCNAGHNPALLLRTDGTHELFKSHGTPLALMPDRIYGSASFTLQTGDQLLLYTDGITEADNGVEDSEGALEEFGLERLLQFFRDQSKAAPSEFEARLSETLTKFTANAPPHDDRTWVLLRRLA
jgi:serine phosphatase RsbU (regulator of sigma subunit)